MPFWAFSASQFGLKRVNTNIEEGCGRRMVKLVDTINIKRWTTHVWQTTYRNRHIFNIYCFFWRNCACKLNVLIYQFSLRDTVYTCNVTFICIFLVGSTVTWSIIWPPTNSGFWSKADTHPSRRSHLPMSPPWKQCFSSYNLIYFHRRSMLKLTLEYDQKYLQCTEISVLCP